MNTQKINQPNLLRTTQKRIYFIALAFILMGNALAKSSEPNAKIKHYFDILKYENTDFEQMGAVCERVAMLEVEPFYPKEKYNLINSIQYDDPKTTIGELDIVIFNKETGLVDAIAEVKCWKSFSGALKKALDQRARFKLYLNRNITLTDENNKIYPKELFMHVQKFFSISQLGGMNQGFDFELSLDFKELMELRSKILDCKAVNQCAAN